LLTGGELQRDILSWRRLKRSKMERLCRLLGFGRFVPQATCRAARAARN
jgi:hypothetical protein